MAADGGADSGAEGGAQGAADSDAGYIGSPRVVPRDAHDISRSNISSYALKVLYRLRDAGYQAHLVGGGVRDLLLGLHPKDFDVATDALPEQVDEVFSNCRLIGRRFRLAHVHFGKEIIEVATFRAPHHAAEEEGQAAENEAGRIVRDNVFGNIEEDAWRRDLTINALYYDINNFSIVDYTGGMADIASRTIRLIGDPKTRYEEDPVRMIRVVRFAAKLGFDIAPETEAPLFELGHLLADVPASRLFEEINKLFLTGNGLTTFDLLFHYGLFDVLFPTTAPYLDPDNYETGARAFIREALFNTDQRIADGKPVTPAFLYAALLWEPVRVEAVELAEDDPIDPMDIRDAAYNVTDKQKDSVLIPKRFQIPMREIWELQPRFARRTGKRAFRLLGHPRFRAAYDFLCLRTRTGEENVGDLCEWWTTFQTTDSDKQRAMASTGPSKRRRGKRRPKPDAESGETAAQTAAQTADQAADQTLGESSAAATQTSQDGDSSTGPNAHRETHPDAGTDSA